MKTYYYFLLLLLIGITQNSYASASERTPDPATMSAYTGPYDDLFPPMEIKLYTGGEPNDGIFFINEDYQFIVQPTISISGFEYKHFKFDWYFIDSSKNVISSVHLSPCGIQVGTFIVNAPESGTYQLVVQLTKADGSSLVVERNLRFGY